MTNLEHAAQSRADGSDGGSDSESDSEPNSETPIIDFLVIGHVTRDLLTNDPNSNDYSLGGTVSFAAVTANHLGYRTALVTRAAGNVDLTPLQDQTALCVLPSETTTTFANIYTPNGRVQYVYTPAGKISVADLPEAFRSPRIALLGPLVNEVNADLASAFSPETLVAAVPQGWMRAWDAEGLVHAIPWENSAEILSQIDVLILSIEDIDGDLGEVERFLQDVPMVVMTQYREGCTVYRRQEDGRIERVPVPPRPADEVDPTGAGDTFATAFLLHLADTEDAIAAARYGNVTASFGVEGIGLENIPTHEMVLDYIAKNPLAQNPLT